MCVVLTCVYTQGCVHYRMQHKHMWTQRLPTIDNMMWFEMTPTWPGVSVVVVSVGKWWLSYHGQHTVTPSYQTQYVHSIANPYPRPIPVGPVYANDAPILHSPSVLPCQIQPFHPYHRPRRHRYKQSNKKVEYTRVIANSDYLFRHTSFCKPTLVFTLLRCESDLE